MQRLVKRVNRCEPGDVSKVTICLDPNTHLELRPKEDFQDIKRLLNSVKHSTVEDRERACNSTGSVTFSIRQSAECGNFRIDGNFDPDNAPVVTPALRSDDLGLTVHAIAKRKSRARSPDKADI